MSLSLLKALDALSPNLPPDEIVERITDPLSRFIKLTYEDLTEELWDKIQNRKVVWYQYHCPYTQMVPCRWTTEIVRLNQPPGWDLKEWGWGRIDREGLLDGCDAGWAVIGAEYKDNPKLKEPVYEPSS